MGGLVGIGWAGPDGRFEVSAQRSDRQYLRDRLPAREARATSALNHPNIVTIYEVLSSGLHPAIVMELVEGTSLRDLGSEPLPNDYVIAIALQVAEAVSAAHEKDIVHGDIKPENIMIRSDRLVKVVDFGLARRTTPDAIAAGGHLGGTLRYWSPAQADGAAATTKNDIFSLGLVLYEMATGRQPFGGQTVAETVINILTRTAPLASSVNPSVPAPFTSLLESMLAKSPDLRPSARDIVRPANGSAKRHICAEQGEWPLFAALSLCVVAAAIAGRFLFSAREPVFHQITTLVAENRATAAALRLVSLAAFANIDGIFVRDMKRGEILGVSSPPDFVTDRLAWFPEAGRLVASGFSSVTGGARIWMIWTSGAPPQLLKEAAREATPSPNGKSIAYIGANWSDLWILSVDPGGAHSRAALEPQWPNPARLLVIRPAQTDLSISRHANRSLCSQFTKPWILRHWQNNGRRAQHRDYLCRRCGGRPRSFLNVGRTGVRSLKPAL